MGVRMPNKFALLVLLAVVQLLSGCITNYQYQSRGEVTATDGDTHKAVLFWHRDEGRLWYGRDHEQPDTSLTMRICQVGVKIFELDKAGYLMLHSKAGDMRVAQVADNGTLVPLGSGQRLHEGDNCGVIQVGGAKVSTADLRIGMQPTVAILCENATRPDRYPAVAGYQFRAITRSKTDEARSAPDPCVALE